MTSLTCIHTLYTNTKINTNSRCQHSQYYMCTYPIQEHKPKQKLLLPKSPVLYVYIPYTTTQTKTLTILSRMNEAFQRLYHPTVTCPNWESIHITKYFFNHSPIPETQFRSYMCLQFKSNYSSKPSTSLKTSEFQYIVPSFEHYDNNSYIPSHVALNQGILVHHLHLF